MHIGAFTGRNAKIRKLNPRISGIMPHVVRYMTPEEQRVDVKPSAERFDDITGQIFQNEELGVDIVVCI